MTRERPTRLAVTDGPARWRPTTGHLRAHVAPAAIVVALVWRRPDLLVLVTPLAIVATWSALTRPRATPLLLEGVGRRILREGDATAWHGTLTGADAVDVVVAGVPDHPWFDRRPEAGAVVAGVEDGAAEVRIVLRATRWGRHLTEPVRVVAAGAWGAFRWETTTAPALITVLPVPGIFDANAALRPATGLVGLHRSSRPGEGSEFAGVRPFVTGDRMRRVNWPRSLRSGALHVNTAWADQDTHVVLLVDATAELGVSGGIDGNPSSLDTTVRAAAAIAEHYARRGDRVSLRVFGGPRAPHVPPGTGRPHLRRILDALASVRAERDRFRSSTFDRRSLTITGDVLAVMLSPLATSDALDRAVSLGRHGVAVAVLDTLPDHLTEQDDDARAALAWRVRLLERAREIRLVQRVGVPVITWRGPGSLDQFLHHVARRAAAPRMRAR